MKQKSREHITFINKKALHDYFILDRFETGIVLKGTEVKSLRCGRVNLRDSYASIDNGEIFLSNCHIGHYECGNINNHDPLRKRKLLLHKKEISRLTGKTKEKGLSLIPLKIYFKNGIAKLELGVAKGKKLYDKRQAIKKKTADREMDRAMREKNKKY